MLRRTHCVTRDLKILITEQECSLLLWVPGLSQERVVFFCFFLHEFKFCFNFSFFCYSLDWVCSFQFQCGSSSFSINLSC